MPMLLQEKKAKISKIHKSFTCSVIGKQQGKNDVLFQVYI